MADRKENELTKANNFEYVRALDANGNSIQISKADLVSVLEGLLPVVTTSNKGLMSADLYKYSVKYFVVQGTKMAKLYNKTNSRWTRKGGLVSFSDETKSSLYAFCVVEIAGEQTLFKVSRVYGDDSRIKFYQKDSELYMYYNSTIANNISVIGFSSENIEYSNNTLDDTFTEVEIS